MNQGILPPTSQYAALSRGLLGRPTPVPTVYYKSFVDPRSAAGLALWYDASDASTITLNGTTVSQWRNKSGVERSVVETSASLQPAYKRNGLNSLATVTFDGANDRLLRTASDIALTVLTRSLFFVARLTTDSFERCLFDIGYHMALTQTSTTGRWYDASPSTFTFPAANTAYLCSIVQDAASGDLRINGGVAVATGGATAGGGLGAFGIGTVAAGNALFWQGDIAEVCYYTRRLSDADRQACEGFLAWKWGLTDNLPSSHPYKAVSP